MPRTLDHAEGAGHVQGDPVVGARPGHQGVEGHALARPGPALQADAALAKGLRVLQQRLDDRAVLQHAVPTGGELALFGEGKEAGQ